jgi:CheY-like chemotaxis protein
MFVMSYVLIVDDDPDARETLGKFLQKSGHEVQTAADGQNALNLVLHRRPDVLVLDLLMPEMDGCDLLSILRSYLRLQALPVVVWTCAPDGPQMERAKRLRINGACVKGKSTYDEILAAIQRGPTTIIPPAENSPGWWSN